MLQRVTGGYKGLQGDKGDLWGLQGATKGYKGYRRLGGVIRNTRGYKAFWEGF